MKYLIKGQLYDPIKVGDPGDWNFGIENCKCHDCAKTYGEYHTSGCDEERCPCCGGQLISCDCGTKYDVEDTMTLKELEKLKETQKITNMAIELEIKAMKNEKMKYKDPNIFNFLAALKMTMIAYGVEKDFDSVYKKVVTADTVKDALYIIKDYCEVQMAKEKKKEMEM